MNSIHHQNNFPLIKSWQEFDCLIKEKFSLSISNNCKKNIEIFYNHLKETNHKFNLTRLISLEDFLTFHLFDTLTLINYIQNHRLSTKKYLDIGSGCGVPSILFLLLAQDFDLPIFKAVLCESVQKKARFLEECLNLLNLNDYVQVRAERSESLEKEYKNQFTLVTARAVAKVPKIFSLCKPFLHKKRGVFLVQTTDSVKKYLKNLQDNREYIFTLADKPRYITAIQVNN